MTDLIDAFGLLLDPANWSGSRGILVRLVEHLQLSLPPLIAAMLVAIPAGVLAGHYRRGQAIGTAIANVGRAIPTLALLVFGVVLSLRVFNLGLSYWPTVFALFFLALHPLFTNTYTGIKNVDPALKEAGRGMGYDDRRLLVEVEIPVASPVIFTAVRVAAVQVIATAPIGALAAGGGFGRYIIDGFGQRDYATMYLGILLIAALSILVERALDLVERVAIPTGLREVSDDSVTDAALTSGRAV